jgi:poly-gamma-glutamate capsule biosynthesis protein CapA/YwtB (metallophosphatase superfamily)
VTRRSAVLVALGALGLSGCMVAEVTGRSTSTVETPVVVVVVDEDGAPVTGASLRLDGDDDVVEVDGKAVVELDQPHVGVVSAAGHLDEPVVLSPTDGEVTVRLLRRTSADGSPRIAMHFGGDTMLGRRYLERGARDDTALVTGESSARAVGAAIGPVVSAADLTMLNLETVVGDVPETAALPGKQFVIRSGPETMDLLDELGVDVAVLANNHAYDYGPAGVLTGLEEVRAAGVVPVGVGATPVDAQRGVIVEVGGLAVGVIAATSVPAAGSDRPPPDLVAPARRSWMIPEIGRLRAEGADVVVVQLHSGLQFADVPTAYLRGLSRDLAEAGADLVIAHHPHVLQGFDWVGDALVAHSLGNLVFDQDIGVTMTSAVLRVVHDGSGVVDARVYPVTIDRYRPAFVTGDAAAATLRLLDARSVLGASAEDPARPDGLPRSVWKPGRRRPAVVVADGSAGVVTAERTAALRTVLVDNRGIAPLPPCTLVQPGDEGLAFAVDLFGWGGVDDLTADGRAEGAVHWVLRGEAQVVADDGDHFIRLGSRNGAGAGARPVARAWTPEHRLFDESNRPLDGDAEYRLELRARGLDGEPATVKVVAYGVEDRLREVVLPLDVPQDGRWHELEIDVTDVVADGTERAEWLMFQIDVPEGAGDTDLDDVRLVEWREPDPVLAEQWLAADAVRGEPGAVVVLTTSGCPDDVAD